MSVRQAAAGACAMSSPSILAQGYLPCAMKPAVILLIWNVCAVILGVHLCCRMAYVKNKYAVGTCVR